MRKVFCILLSVCIIFGLCACSGGGHQAERQSMYDIIESGDRDAILSAADDAKEKNDTLYSLTSSFLSVWNSYKDGEKTLDDLKATREPLIDFLVEEGFSEAGFTGSDAEIAECVIEISSLLREEYIAINKEASEILKQEAVDKLTGNNN